MVAGVPENTHSRDAGESLFEQIQLLGRQFREHLSRTSYVAAGSREARHITARNRVAVNEKDHRDRPCRLSSSASLRRCPCHDEVHVESDELCGESGKPLVASFAVAIEQSDVPTLDPATLAQALSKRRVQVR
jgi:hypothetical protein